MWTISKDFGFSAAHHLDGLGLEHPCTRPHGHNYQVRITLSAEHLDATGMVLDYRDLAPVGKWIDTALDHQDLNTVPILQGINPTAENLARVIAETAQRMLPGGLPEGVTLSAAVSETPKTWATWTP